jgi:hypothetical protein
MATAREVQLIKVVRDVPAQVDTSAALIALLDATLAHHDAITALAAAVPGASRSSFQLLDLRGDDDAERVVKLWASARNLQLCDESCDVTLDPAVPSAMTSRTITVSASGRDLVRVHFKLQPKVDAAAVREALAKPFVPTEDDRG